MTATAIIIALFIIGVAFAMLFKTASSLPALVHKVVSTRQNASPRSAVAIARARLEREISSLEAKLASQLDTRDPVAVEVRSAQQAWWQVQLAKTTIAALDVEGFGPATYEMLKESGFAWAADVQRLDRVRIRNFGDRKRSALASAYRRFCNELERQSQKLTLDELDAFAGGTIARLRDDMSARSREKLRADEAMRVRLAELQRRHAAITTSRR